jgi:hypothetical protein
MLCAALKSTNMFWRAVLPGVNPAFVERLELKPRTETDAEKKDSVIFVLQGMLDGPPRSHLRQSQEQEQTKERQWHVRIAIAENS